MISKNNNKKEEIIPQDNNSDIITGIIAAGVLAIGGYLLYTNMKQSEEPEQEQEQEEEEYIPAKIAQPMVVYEDRFPDFYPYKSFANPARRPYFGGTPIPIPLESIVVPPPVLGYWNPAYPSVDSTI